MYGTTIPLALILQADGIIPRGSRVEIFDALYGVFLALGTLVGIVVIGYMLYNAYKYRAGGEAAEKILKAEEAGKPAAPGVNRPKLGELPQGSGGGRKLFLSFALSAIIVISLIAWAYGILLYVEEGAAAEPPTEQAEVLEVEVEGYQFGWRFIYPNGHTVDSATGESFKVPADTMVMLDVTATDVFHNFGVPDLRVKADAIPGQYTSQWFIAEEPGETYTARCFELCGALHSEMTAEVEVMEQDEWEEWYEGTMDEAEGDDEADADTDEENDSLDGDVNYAITDSANYATEVHV